MTAQEENWPVWMRSEVTDASYALEPEGCSGMSQHQPCFTGMFCSCDFFGFLILKQSVRIQTQNVPNSSCARTLSHQLAALGLEDP